jgi:hypothetical protein
MTSAIPEYEVEIEGEISLWDRSMVWCGVAGAGFSVSIT